MTTITKERIDLFIKAPLENGLTRGEQMELARIALASLDAETVRYLNKFSGTCVTLEQQSNAADDVAVYMPLYVAPPAPVVPDEITSASAPEIFEIAAEAERLGLRGTYASYAVGWNACRAAMLQGAEPVSQTYKLPELIVGMEVSVDVSTCDADAGNRYFGTVTEVSELDSAKNGYILLVQDAEPNFDVNGNSPVIPEGSFSGLVNSARALLDVLYEFGADEVSISEYVTNLEDALRVAAAPKQETMNG